MTPVETKQKKHSDITREKIGERNRKRRERKVERKKREREKERKEEKQFFA